MRFYNYRNCKHSIKEKLKENINDNNIFEEKKE